MSGTQPRRMRTRGNAGASPLAAELPAPTRPRRRKAEAEPAGPPAKRSKNENFATQRVKISEPTHVSSPAVERVKTPERVPVSSPAVESDNDEPTPAATSGLFGSVREVSRPRPAPRRRFFTKTTPLNDAPRPSLPFTAPPATRTTVAEDFAGLLSSGMTPRPYALKTPMVRPGQLARVQSAQKPEKEKSNGKEKELFAPSDDEEDDEDASIHEEEYPEATAQQIRENGRLVLNVNNAYHQHQEHLRIYKEKGLGCAAKSVTLRSGSPDQIIIQIKEVVEKIVTVPGPSMPADFPQNTLIIPASDQGNQMILTDPRIIELARAAAVFLTSDPAHQLPHPSQMTEYLQRLNETGAVDSLVSDNHPTNTESVDPYDALITNNGSSVDHDDLAGTPFALGRSYDQDNNEVPYEVAMTNALGSHARFGDESEVEGPASSPFIATPAQPNTPVAASATSNVNRGFFDGVKSMLTSPLKRFGIVGNTPRGSTTKNDVGMAGYTPQSGARMGGNTPATIDRFGITPSADINFSPTDLRDPKSPTPFNKRIQKKRKIQKQNASILKSQSNEAQRMQATLEDDIHQHDREKKRVAFMARDEVRTYTPVTPDLSPPKAKKGKKAKKVKQPKPKKEGYSVPSDSESSTDEDEDEEEESSDEESTPQDATHGSQKRRHDGSRIDAQNNDYFHYPPAGDDWCWPVFGAPGYLSTFTREGLALLKQPLEYQKAYFAQFQTADAHDNGSRIDSHHDESSTSPAASTYSNGDQMNRGRNNGYANFLKQQAADPNYQPATTYVDGRPVDMHRDSFPYYPMSAYDKYADSPLNNASNFSQSGARMHAPVPAGTYDPLLGFSQFLTPNRSRIDSNTVGTVSQVDSHHDESARIAQANGSGFTTPFYPRKDSTAGSGSQAAGTYNNELRSDPNIEYAAQFFQVQNNGSQNSSTTAGTGSQIDSHHDESARNAQAAGFGYMTPLDPRMDATTVGTVSQIDSHLDESARSAQVSDFQPVAPFGNGTDTPGDSASPPAPRSPGRSFCPPDWSDESDEEEDPVAPNVLDEKKNEQAVPAPPRPANAVLPPPYNKYVPEKKSFLSFMENMSPMQVAEADKENNLNPWEAADAARSLSPDSLPQIEIEDSHNTIDPRMVTMSQAVLDAVDNLPDSALEFGASS